MNKSIELNHRQWVSLEAQLTEDYPRSVMLLRSRMKAKLGFTNRVYKDWSKDIGKYGGYKKHCVMLDFFSEKKLTFFLMKYSDYIQPEVRKSDF